MVSLIGWMIGLTASAVLLCGCIFGLLSFYHSRKLKAELLAVAGLVMIFLGLLYLGPLVDFLLVIFTGKNLNPEKLVSLLSYTWVAPGLILAMYLGAEMMIPKKKWIIVGIYAVLGIIFELFLWLDTDAAFYYTLGIPGEDLIDASYYRTHPMFILIVIFLVSVFVFNGIGFLLKAFKTTGEIRKKYLYLGLGFIIFTISGVFDSLVAPGIGLLFARMGMLVYIILVYMGVKT
ncbi:MAG: hypothetical protein ACFFAO_10925 [Candidatus Hermodarchaeota archaeon]